MQTTLKFVAIAALLALSLPATAQIGAKYTVTNDTGGTGGTFPVTTLVTFNTLDLVETFNDSTTLDVPIFRNNVQVTSLTPFQLSAATKGVNIQNVQSAKLTGIYSRTDWMVTSTPNGPKMAVTVLSSFSANISPVTNSRLVPVFGIDATSGQTYEAGQFNTSASTIPAVTPEPGAFALLVSVGLAGAWWRRRRSI